MATSETTTGALGGGGFASRTRAAYLDGQYVTMMPTIPAGVDVDADLLTLLYEGLTGTDTSHSVQTGTTYSLLQADSGSTVSFTNAALVTVTVPTNAVLALAVGYQVIVSSEGVGGLTLDTTGLTLRGVAPVTTALADEALYLQKTATDTWLVLGGS